MPSPCVYPRCQNSSRYCDPGVRFHRFPTNQERAMQWAINCRSPMMMERVSKGRRFYMGKMVCSLHFERACFMNDLKVSLTKLAVPTMFTDTPIESTSDSPSSFNINKLDTNCDLAVEEVQQLNNNKTKLHFTLAEIISETVGLDKNQRGDIFVYDDEDLPRLFSETNPIVGSEELHATDIDLPQRDPTNTDPSEGTEAFYQNGETMFATVTISTSERHPQTETVPPVEEKTVLRRVAEYTSKELLCRLCAKLVCMSQMVHIFGKSNASKEYLHKINQLLPISEQPAENDGLPKWICTVCCERLNYCDQAIHDFISASVKLNRLLSTALSKKHTALMEVESTSLGSSNSRSATRQANDESVEDHSLAIKEECLGDEQFEERLLHSIDCSAKRQHSPVTTTVQQIREERVPRAGQTGNCVKLCSTTNSVLADHSHQCTCLQCVDAFPDKCSRLFNTVHTSRAEYEMNVVRKSQTIPLAKPLDSQDCSFSESVVLYGDIQRLIKRKSHQLDNDTRSTSVSPSPKLIKIEGVDRVDDSKVSNSLVTNKHLLLSSTSSSRSKKVKQVGEQEKCHGKIIQCSHTMIPTASDNKSFLCKKCDIAFSSIESVLTHRFKEHPEEILCTRPK